MLKTERYERPLNRLTVNFRVRHTHLRSWRDLTLPNPTRRESSTREPRQTSELVNPVLNLCSIKESLWYFVVFANGVPLVGNWKIWTFLAKKIYKEWMSRYLPTFEIRGLFLHKFSCGIKNSSCLLQCSLIPESSPNSRMLSFEARMLVL